MIHLDGTGINPASPAFEAARATDPTTRTTPPSDPSNYSIAEGTGDLWLLVPSTINVNSPAFTKAAEACNFH